jgi:hypothetical protein
MRVFIGITGSSLRVPGSPATDAESWMPPVVSDDEYADGLTSNAKEKVIREPVEICPAEVALTDLKRFGAPRCFEKEAAELGVKLVCEGAAGDALVIVHDRIDVGLDFPMQDEPHQRRRALM